MSEVQKVPTVSPEDVEKIARNLHHDPFQVLRPHQVEFGRKKKWVVRAWLPDAESVWVRTTDRRPETPMYPVHNEHFFEAVMSDWEELPLYQFHIVAHNGHERYVHDPYFFLF